jgi:hypothetical protein
MHAYAATDPVFLAMNARGQKETKGQLGTFCVGCHAPLAVQEGATDGSGDLTTLPAELRGVTCYFCHQVTDVQGTHNNPLLLANDTTMRGGIGDALPNDAHGTAYSSLHASAKLESAKLCGSCHDIVVPGHFSHRAEGDAGATAPDVPLEQTYSEWQGSVFSDPAQQIAFSCNTCHFKQEHGVPIANPPGDHPPMRSRTRHRHDLPAVDTALFDFPEKPALPRNDDQRAKIESLLSLALRIEICADFVKQQFQVTLENLSAGHRFPSGASQDRRLWVEVHGLDAQGAELFPPSGAVPAGTPATSVAGTWILRDEALKADGVTPATMFWDVASVTQRTIPVAPRDGTPDFPNYTIRTYPLHVPREALDRIDVTVWLEPIGLDVLDDLISAGYLDASVRAKMPRFPLVPPTSSADASAARPFSLTWKRPATLGNGSCQSTDAKPAPPPSP